MVHIFARKTGFEPSSKVGFSLGDPILDTMLQAQKPAEDQTVLGAFWKRKYKEKYGKECWSKIGK